MSEQLIVIVPVLYPLFTQEIHQGGRLGNIMNQNYSLDDAVKTSYISLIVNVLLTVGKFLAGFFGNSMVMIADALHSASDVLSTFIVIAAVKIAGKPADSDHEYGHERFESIGALILSVMLAIIGGSIGLEGIKTLIAGNFNEADIPTFLALGAAIISILVKEMMFQYTKRVGERCRSEALIADAWHHRSDAMSSVGSLIGIGAARFGFTFMDPLASVIVCIFILLSSVKIFLAAVNKLTDHSCPKDVEEEMHNAISKVAGVIEIDVLKTRQFGANCYVDVEISVDAELSLKKAHNIAEEVHHLIETEFDNVKHCTVHVNPFEIQNIILSVKRKNI